MKTKRVYVLGAPVSAGHGAGLERNSADRAVYFQDFPDEVVFLILQSLDFLSILRLSEVSRQLGDTVRRWARTRTTLRVGNLLRKREQTPSPEFMVKLFNFFPCIETLNLDAWRWTETFPNVASCLMTSVWSETLRAFEARNHPIFYEDLHHFSRRCPNITRLQLRGCSLVNDTFLTQRIMHLWPYSLSEIDISNCNHVSNVGLLRLVSTVSNVTANNLKRVSNTLVFSARGRDTSMKSSVCISSMSNVQNIRFEQSVNLEKLRLANNVRMHTLHVYANNLTVAILSDCRTLQDLHLHCPRLEVLNLSGCRLINCDAVNALDELRCLKQLNLNGAVSLSSIALTLPLLEELHLIGCSKLQVVKLTCPSLRRLALPGHEFRVDIQCRVDTSIHNRSSKWMTRASGIHLHIE